MRRNGKFILREQTQQRLAYLYSNAPERIKNEYVHHWLDLA